MSSILNGKFAVEFEKSVEDYDVKLTMHKLKLKPRNPIKGKWLSLEKPGVLSCSVFGNQDGFKVVHSWEPKNFEYTTYNFIMKDSSSKNSIEVADTAERWVDAVCSNFEISGKNYERELLVVVNPKAGRGKALLTYKKLKNVLNETGHEHSVLITQAADHALNFVREKVNIEKWGCILFLSGDGTITEVINGIFQLENFQDILKNMAIGVIPVGSGTDY